jgi:hypothetical protein
LETPAVPWCIEYCEDAATADVLTCTERKISSSLISRQDPAVENREF